RAPARPRGISGASPTTLKGDVIVRAREGKTMNVKISGEAELFIREEVASGRYDSPQDVVQEGLRLLHEREHLDQRQWRERLNGQTEEGLAQLDRGEGI